MFIDAQPIDPGNYSLDVRVVIGNNERVILDAQSPIEFN